jgi:hypothetical protein
VDGEGRFDRTWLLESEPAIGIEAARRSGVKRRPRRRPSMRLELWRLLAIVALAGLFFAAFRSFLLADLVGLLVWPVMLGFGIDRLGRGHGVLGGTLAGCLALISSNPDLDWVAILAAMGATWGFYLSVWLYILFETLIYYFY